MYERRTEPLISRAAFLRRVALHAGAALALVGVSLLAGMVGYHVLEGLSWLDSFVNASMLLGGMGPVATLQTNGGKLFAGLYALYSGMVFLIAVGVVFAPVLHRFLHHFHLEADEDDSATPTPPSKGTA